MKEMGVLCDFHGTLVDANKAWADAFASCKLSNLDEIIDLIYKKVNRKIICADFGLDYDDIKNKYVNYLVPRDDVVNLVKKLSYDNTIIIISNSSRVRLMRDINQVKEQLGLNIIAVYSKEDGNKNDALYIENILDKHHFDHAYIVGNDIREDFNPSAKITNIFVPYKNTILLNKSL